MSNTVIILANAYEQFNNKTQIRNTIRRSNSVSNVSNNSNRRVKWKELWDFIVSDKWILAMLVLTIIGLGIFIAGSLLKTSIWIMFTGIVLYIIGLVVIVIKVEKNEVKNYKERRRNYYKKLKKFNSVLIYEFKIDSKDKLEYILKECDETSKVVGQEIKIVGKFICSWQNIIYPLITITISTLLGIDTFKNSLTWQDVIIGIVSIVTTIIMIIILLKIIQSIIEPFINSNKNRVNTLKTILNDIYLNYYIR